MRNVFVFLTVSLCIGLPNLMAQQPGEIAQLFRVKAKPGHELQLEAGVVEHYKWHRQAGDSWKWENWQFMSGEYFGQFVARTGEHHWADFDTHAEFSRRDNEDVANRLGDHIESTTVWFTRTRSQSSSFPERDAQFPLIEVISYTLKPGKESEFLHVIDIVHEVLQKSNWPQPYIWTQTVAGGEGSEMSLVLPMESWSALEPPEKNVPAVLEEVLGRQGSEAILDLFVSSVESNSSDILIRRPDLSYSP